MRTYMHQIHTPHTYTTYMHHIHAPNTCTKYMHQIHAPNTYTTYIHHIHAYLHDKEEPKVDASHRRVECDAPGSRHDLYHTVHMHG